jgi:alkanesulfonate monooxygenase SsuD/methylene tetrahydromethanopterin reductase-like flavin-dependent oxidoreductase (luciferase family)
MDYRVYIIGRDERFIGVREIAAPDDKAALRKAKRYVGERDVEVWQRERRVGRIASADQNPVVQLVLRRLAQKLEKT